MDILEEGVNESGLPVSIYPSRVVDEKIVSPYHDQEGERYSELGPDASSRDDNFSRWGLRNFCGAEWVAIRTQENREKFMMQE